MPTEEKSMTILGKPVTQRANGTYAMTKADHRAILAELGVTDEVQATVNAANTAIERAGIEFLSQHVDDIVKAHEGRIATAKQAVAEGKATVAQQRLAGADPKAATGELVFGSSEGRLRISLETKAEHNGNNPRTREPVHSVKYGVVTIEQHHEISPELDDLLTQVSKDCEKSFGGK